MWYLYVPMFFKAIKWIIAYFESNKDKMDAATIKEYGRMMTLCNNLTTKCTIKGIQPSGVEDFLI